MSEESERRLIGYGSFVLIVLVAAIVVLSVLMVRGG